MISGVLSMVSVTLHNAFMLHLCCNIYLSFIFQKNFNMFTCLLRNLYAGQEATVRTGHGTTDWFRAYETINSTLLYLILD